MGDIENILDKNKHSLKKYTKQHLRVSDKMEFHKYMDETKDYKNVVKDLIKDASISTIELDNLRTKAKVGDIETVIEKEKEELKKKVIIEEKLNEDTGEIEEVLETKDGFDEYIELFEKKNKDDLIKKKEQDELKIKQEYKEKIITECYGFIYQNLINMSLCFNNFKTTFEDFKKLQTIELKGFLKEPDIAIFLKNFRKSAPIYKMNYIALQIGKYNFDMIFNIASSLEYINNRNAKVLSNLVYKQYEGSEFDFKALENFYKIVEGDKSGKYIFEEEREQLEKEKKREEILERIEKNMEEKNKNKRIKIQIGTRKKKE